MTDKTLLLLCALWTFQEGFSKDPESALQELVEGNRRYVKEELLHPNRSLERREELTTQQTPFATIVGCSDSRVTPEIIFDQGLGDLFIVRVAGNVVGSLELESINYSVQALGSSLVVVVGHEACGAVTAVFQGNTGGIQDIAALVKPGIQGTKTIKEAIKANVRSTVSNLKKTKAIAKLIADKKIDCIGAYYDLSSGHVELLK